MIRFHRFKIALRLNRVAFRLWMWSEKFVAHAQREWLIT